MEGFMDVIAAYRAGIENAVAHEQLRLLNTLSISNLYKSDYHL